MKARKKKVGLLSATIEMSYKLFQEDGLSLVRVVTYNWDTFSPYYRNKQLSGGHYTSAQ